MTNANEPPHFQKEDYLEKPLPSSDESERVILGGILLDNSLMDEAIELKLAPTMFYSPTYKAIYRAMFALYEADKKIDPILISEELKKGSGVEMMGGITTITQLTFGLPHFSKLNEYIEIVKEKALARHIIKVTNKTVSDILAEDTPTSDLIDQLEDSIYNFSNFNKHKEMYTSLKVPLAKSIEQYKLNKDLDKDIEGLATGYLDLDYYLSGLKKQNLIIVGGRPSMGKTALVLNIVQNLPEANEDFLTEEEIVVLIFTLEMSEEELQHRLLVSAAEVNSQRLKMWNLSQAEKDRVYAAEEKLKNYKFIIDDEPSVTTNYMKAKAKRVEKATKRKLDLIVVDYLQLLDSDVKSYQSNRQQDLTKISRQLKLMARVFDCPLIALSQLSRDPESRVTTNFRPILKDLRESGAIEQDADTVMFVYREDYYKSDPDEPDTNVTEIIISKQRNGPVGTVKLFFEKEFTKFRNLEEDQLESTFDNEF